MEKYRDRCLSTKIFLLLVFLLLIVTPSSVHAASETQYVTIKVSNKTKKKTITTYVGDTVVLTVKSGNKKLKYKNLVFKSKNKRIAGISKKGTIIAWKAGTTTITVTTKDKKKSCKIKLKVKNSNEKPIVHSDSVSLNMHEVTINKGESIQLIASVFPENTTDKSISWECYDSSIVSVSPDGLVTGLKEGETSVWAYNRANHGSAYDICRVKVNEPSVAATKLELNHHEATINPEESIQLIATVSPDDTTDKKVTWENYDSTIIAVSEDGLVTGIKPGETTVAAYNRANGASVCDYCLVKVNNPIIAATGFNLDTHEVTINQGETFQLNASFVPEDTTDQTISWENYDNNVISVSPDGVVTGISRGETTIWANHRANGVTLFDLCTVKVRGRVDRSGSAGSNINYTISGYDNDLALVLSGSGNMTNYDGDNQPWNDINDQITSIKVGNGITSIGDYAFYYFINARTVDIPPSLKRIGRLSFCGCRSLGNLTFPNSLTEIGFGSFWECKSFTYILIPANVTSIGDEAFQDCINVISARVEANYSTLPNGLFWGCSNMEEVRIPAVSEIDSFALYQCPNLTTIYYGGSSEQWNNVNIRNYNDDLRNKDIIFNAQ